MSSFRETDIIGNVVDDKTCRVKKFTVFLFFIFSIIAIYVSTAPIIIKETYGPDVRQQAKMQFEQAAKKKYECLFIGSSEIYHGINPDKLSVSSFNFAFGAETFNQEWYKLKYLEEKEVSFKYLVLGLDFSDFSVFQKERNHAYFGYLDNAYFKDYDGIDTVKEVNDTFNQYVVGHYIDKIPDFVKAVGRIVLLGENRSKDITSYGELKESKKNVIKDLPNKLKIQEKYFSKIIQYSKEKDIRLFIVVPPKYRSYDTKVTKEYEQYIKEKIKGTNIVYLNYQDNSAFKHFDFYDDTHLTESGADKFTKMIDEVLRGMKKQK